MNQSTIEHLLHTQHIKRDLISYILGLDELNKAVELWVNYINQEYWESKNNRLDLVRELNSKHLLASVLANIVLIAPKHRDSYVPLIQIATSKQFKNMDKLQSIHTFAEIMYCLDTVDLTMYTINQDNTRALMANIDLPDELQHRLEHSCVLPPLVSLPKTVRSNKDTPYQTIDKDSLILGYKENYHDKELSLDVLNKLNRTQLVLNQKIIDMFPRQFEYLDTADMDDDELEAYRNQKITFDKKQEQFKYYYELIKDIPFYFSHKYDKRGRVYSQGYQFNTQGDSLDKASIEFKVKEYITGEL